MSALRKTDELHPHPQLGPGGIPREAQARSARLKELEAIIERSAKAVWDMAEALKEIREQKLWDREHGGTHTSWTAYCDERWGISLGWAAAMIAAVGVRQQLKDSSAPKSLPTHVAQAVELAQADEGDREAVWQKAVEGASGDAGPSTREVRRAVKEHKAAAAPPIPRPSRAQLAHDAAHETKRLAQSFQLSVRSLMPYLDMLPENETETCAYMIVQTVHAVIQILEEAGHLKRSVTGRVAACSDPPRITDDGRKIELQPVTLEDHKILMQRALDTGCMAWGVLANVVDATLVAEGLTPAERVQWASLAREGADSLRAFADDLEPAP